MCTIRSILTFAGGLFSAESCLIVANLYQPKDSALSVSYLGSYRGTPPNFADLTSRSAGWYASVDRKIRHKEEAVFSVEPEPVSVNYPKRSVEVPVIHSATTFNVEMIQKVRGGNENRPDSHF